LTNLPISFLEQPARGIPRSPISGTTGCGASLGALCPPGALVITDKVLTVPANRIICDAKHPMHVGNPLILPRRSYWQFVI